MRGCSVVILHPDPLVRSILRAVWLACRQAVSKAGLSAMLPWCLVASPPGKLLGPIWLLVRFGADVLAMLALILVVLLAELLAISTLLVVALALAPWVLVRLGSFICLLALY